MEGPVGESASPVRAQLLSRPRVGLWQSPSHHCWAEAILEFPHWRGLSEKASFSNVKYLEPGLKYVSWIISLLGGAAAGS